MNNNNDLLVGDAHCNWSHSAILEWDNINIKIVNERHEVLNKEVILNSKILIISEIACS